MPAEPDPANSELIARLCLEAGRIMEDTSVELALILPSDLDERTARLARLQIASPDIQALAAAAMTLHRRCLDHSG